MAGPLERAVNVRREAMASTYAVVLRDRYPDEWLVTFWEAARPDHEIGRSQGLHAAYNGIARQRDAIHTLSHWNLERTSKHGTIPRGDKVLS